MSDATLKVFYGPPGTGKTWNAKREAVRIVAGEVDESDVNSRHQDLVEQGRIWWVTFHPNYSYEDFVEGYRPVAGPTGLSYEVREGPFKLACRAARGDSLGNDYRALPVGYQFTEGSGTYEVADCDHAVIQLRRRDGDKLEARRPVAWATVESIVKAIRDGKIELADLKYPKGAGVASSAKGKVSAATDVATHYLSDEVPIRALVKYVLTRDVAVGEVLTDKTGKGRYEVIEVDDGGWVLRSKPDREDQVAEALERHASRFIVEKCIDRGLDPRVFSIPGGSMRDPADFGIAEGDLPEPVDDESVGRRKGPTLRKWVGGQLDISSTEVANMGYVGAIYRRIVESRVESSPLPVVLVIDEINRADLSRVFGELITLIELDKREGAAEAASVVLPYSRERFSVPSTLSVVATMNTADRSLSVFDIALRRRFSFVEVGSDPSQCSESYGGVDVSAALRRWNRRIERLIGKDLAIGHGELMDASLNRITANRFKGDSAESQLRGLSAVVREKIAPLLLEYFHDDWRKAEFVLGNRGLIDEMVDGEDETLGGDDLDWDTDLSCTLPSWWDPDSSDFDEDATRAALSEVAPSEPGE